MVVGYTVFQPHVPADDEHYQTLTLKSTVHPEHVVFYTYWATAMDMSDVAGT